MGIKYAVNEDFFDVWSHEMAYVLGFLYADGSMENAPLIRGKYLRVTNTDADRVYVIRRLLNSKHKVIVVPNYGIGKISYFLRIGSHKLYDRLMEIGMTPNKSLTMEFPDVPIKYLSSFVRGYFDGDGCVSFNRYKKPSGAEVKRLITIFTSGSRKFLKSLHDMLESNVGIRDHVLHTHSNGKASQLRYSIESSKKLFSFMYGSLSSQELSLMRKYDIFDRYFKERSDLVDSGTRKTLKRMNGLVAKKQRDGLQNRYAGVRIPSRPPQQQIDR